MNILQTISAAFLVLLPFMATAAAQESAGQKAEVTYPEVSEKVCPGSVISIASKAGNQVTAVVRQPPGSGPFPAIILLHGGLSTYPTQKLKSEAISRPSH